MTAYLTPETAEALRALWNEWALEVNTRDDQGVRQEDAQEFFRRLDALIDSLPIVGAVPAEEALERIMDRVYALLRYSYDPTGPRPYKLEDVDNADFAAVRHALRAAQAQADAGLRPSVRWFAAKMEATLRKHDAAKGGQANWRKDHAGVLYKLLLKEVDEMSVADGPALVEEAVDVANFAMMIADVLSLEADDSQPSPQADAPPPPDVIRRGHEALEMEWKIADLIRAHTHPATAFHAEQEKRLERIEAIRSAMPPLPKEE